jgi:hypothetical protein
MTDKKKSKLRLSDTLKLHLVSSKVVKKPAPKKVLDIVHAALRSSEGVGERYDEIAGLMERSLREAEEAVEKSELKIEGPKKARASRAD